MKDVTWTARRHGQNWRDDDMIAAIEWLASTLSKSERERRETATAEYFSNARSEWSAGRRCALFDAQDQIAWYLYQARCYADPAHRPHFFEPEGYRIAPMMRRLGQLLPDLKSISGSEERAARLLTEGKAQPDDGIYELLVAGAYKRRGWDSVAFVPEMPGIQKRPDLFIERDGPRWAVECKRTGRSGYAHDELIAGQRMADHAHVASRAVSRPVIIMVRFAAELKQLPETYLSEKIELRSSRGAQFFEWKDEGGFGGIADVCWEPLLQVLRSDDVLFGSSRMIELLLGEYKHSVDYSVKGQWTPAEGRPFHATAVSHVSVVAWTSTSIEAARRKARHFRGVVAQASEQLPGDCRGAVHVGYEALGGNSVDGLRHSLNGEQMQTFDARDSNLQGVYGNYFMPEHVIARLESAAITESMAWYPVRQPSRTPQPLPGHMLFMDEDGRPGAHFTR